MARSNMNCLEHVCLVSETIPSIDDVRQSSDFFWMLSIFLVEFGSFYDMGIQKSN